LPLLRHPPPAGVPPASGLEQDNLRAPSTGGLTIPDDERGVELAGALFWFWTKRGLYEEGAARGCERARRRHPTSAIVSRRALIGLAHMHHFQGRPLRGPGERGPGLRRTRRRMGGPSRSRCSCRASRRSERGDRTGATPLRTQATRLPPRQRGALVQRSGPLLILATTAVSRGDYDAAQAFYDGAIDASRRVASVGTRHPRSLQPRGSASFAGGDRTGGDAGVGGAVHLPGTGRSARHRLEPGRPSRASSPPEGTPTTPRGHGARPTGCSKAWAARCRRRSDGSGRDTWSPARQAIGAQHFDTARAAGREMPFLRRLHAREPKRALRRRIERCSRSRTRERDEHEDLRSWARRVRHQAHRGDP
jgi:hypothetical protein